MATPEILHWGLTTFASSLKILSYPFRDGIGNDTSTDNLPSLSECDPIPISDEEVDRDALDAEQDISFANNEAGYEDGLSSELVSTTDDIGSHVEELTCDDVEASGEVDSEPASTSPPDEEYPSYQSTGDFDYSDLEMSSEAEMDEYPAYQSDGEAFSDERLEGEDVDVEEQGQAIE